MVLCVGDASSACRAVGLVLFSVTSSASMGSFFWQHKESSLEQRFMFAVIYNGFQFSIGKVVCVVPNGFCFPIPKAISRVDHDCVASVSRANHFHVNLSVWPSN